MAFMNYLESDMSNSTNTVVHFDEKSFNRLRTRSHTMYVLQVDCSIFHPAKFGQPITHQHVLLWRKSLTGGTAVTIILCLHVGPMIWGFSLYIGPGPGEPRRDRESLKGPIDVYFDVFILDGGIFSTIFSLFRKIAMSLLYIKYICYLDILLHRK